MSHEFVLQVSDFCTVRKRSQTGFISISYILIFLTAPRPCRQAEITAPAGIVCVKKN